MTESLVFQLMIGCSLGVVFVAGWLYYNYTNSKAVPMPAVEAKLAHDEPSGTAAKVAAPEVTAAKVAAAKVATPEVVTRDREGSGERDGDGRYIFDVVVNGLKMPMRYNDDMEFVTLRAEDAIRLGISFNRLDFATKIRTAKGVTDVAGITINTMTIGTITYHLVPGYVTRQGALDENILGHSFLGRLAEYRLENNRLILVDRRGQRAAVLANGHVTR